ncbi:hypothetical protein Pint_34629 [Pistacia integerrima]|uniref:Uncharacterized protein n=1 Tax=Pistacia integerrima TaxID=434235 RepID=A0ACC0X6I2_9ROSI|nr:hypothetical protein Pint_34629 [Pistacia integerrima]
MKSQSLDMEIHFPSHSWHHIGREKLVFWHLPMLSDNCWVHKNVCSP